jgi:hypothetical protein
MDLSRICISTRILTRAFKIKNSSLSCTFLQILRENESLPAVAALEGRYKGTKLRHIQTLHTASKK